MKSNKNNFSDNAFWKKLKKYATKAGAKTVYTSLLLYYAYRRKETPRWAKNIILGSLGYFLSPIDLIPDLTPFLGFSDDIMMMSASLLTVSIYINEPVRNKAKSKLSSWFGDDFSKAIDDVDSNLDSK